MRTGIWGCADSHPPSPDSHSITEGWATIIYIRGRVVWGMSWLRPQNRVYGKGRRKRSVSTAAHRKVGDLVFRREKMGCHSKFSLKR